MPRYSKRSKERLASCDERLQEVFNEVIKHVDCSVLEGHRSKERQNKLYDEGHTIVFFTARGLASGRGEQHYRPITEQQLKEWGVKYHELCFKGHNGDYFIDDRGINAKDFFNDTDIS